MTYKPANRRWNIIMVECVRWIRKNRRDLYQQFSELALQKVPRGKSGRKVKTPDK